MPSGWLLIPSFVPGAKRLYKEVLGATSWPVFVARVFVIFAQDPGNPIIKTTLSAIFTKRVKLKL